MIFSRDAVESAIAFWGAKAGKPNGLTLPPKTGRLIEVLATMNFFKQLAVELDDGDECVELIREAQSTAAVQGSPT